MKTWFVNLKIRSKLLLSCSFVAVIAAIVGLVGSVGLSKLNSNTSQLIDVRIPSSRSLLALSDAQQAVWVGERGLINQQMMSPDIRRAQYAWIDAAFARADTANAVLNDLPKNNEQKALWEKVKSSWRTWTAAHKVVRDFAEQKDRLVASNVPLSDKRIVALDDQAFKASLDSRQKALEMQKDLKEMIALDDQITRETAQQSTATESLVSAILWGAVIVAVVLAMFLGIVITNLIATPVRQALEMVRHLSRGSLGMRLEVTSGDEVGEMSQAMNALADMLKGIARTLDMISRGDLSVTVTRLGESDEITPSLSRTVDSLQGLVAQMQLLSDAAVEGQLSMRGDVSMFDGGYRDIVAGVNATLEAVIGPLTTAAHYVDAISKGEIPAKITEEYHGDFNTLKTNLNVCIEAVNALVADTKLLSANAIEGHLSTRADATRHHGDFRKVVEGVNATLDAVVDPLRVSSDVLAGIGKGLIPKKIAMGYKGDFAEIEKSLNNCIDGLEGLKEGAFVMSRLAVNDLTHTVKGNYEGIFGDIAKAVNETHDRLSYIVAMVEEVSQGRMTQLEKIRAVGRRSEEDELLPSFIRLYENIGRLTAEVITLSGKATDGNLAARANTDGLEGEFLKMVAGLNSLLDMIIRPVEEGRAIMEKMAEGDLTARVTGDYRGDHARLKDSINSVADSLERALKDVAEAVSAAASASNQISSSTEELAAGTQEQTSQAAEVAGAVEEMAKTILENSRNASETANVAKEAKVNAEAGGQVVADTVKGMRRIAEVVGQSAETVKELGKSSDQIGEIITVIDDIADQTNLLALNAAIEAARAGDQGRGFAVVADEVRKLAERTTKATKEIAGMIKKIQQDTHGAVTSMRVGTQEVESGIALADKAGVALGDIVRISQRVTDMVSQIAAASEQQSSASEQISKNVEAISSVTSQSAGGTQQIARAAEDLSRMSDNLQRLIGRFVLSKENKSEEVRGEGKGSIAVRANGKLVKHAH
ncbi:MAG TPA: methyl-accepting chemotaxis protein [Bacteroidota bacterium]|nr:methyl-accepting chemotaxis protein [Bacteroidota bacterium]